MAQTGGFRVENDHFQQRANAGAREMRDRHQAAQDPVVWMAGQLVGHGRKIGHTFGFLSSPSGPRCRLEGMAIWQVKAEW